MKIGGTDPGGLFGSYHFDGYTGAPYSSQFLARIPDGYPDNKVTRISNWLTLCHDWNGIIYINYNATMRWTVHDGTWIDDLSNWSGQNGQQRRVTDANYTLWGNNNGPGLATALIHSSAPTFYYLSGNIASDILNSTKWAPNHNDWTSSGATSSVTTVGAFGAQDFTTNVIVPQLFTAGNYDLQITVDLTTGYGNWGRFPGQDKPPCYKFIGADARSDPRNWFSEGANIDVTIDRPSALAVGWFGSNTSDRITYRNSRAFDLCPPGDDDIGYG
jgi:hypothetical protein